MLNPVKTGRGWTGKKSASQTTRPSPSDRQKQMNTLIVHRSGLCFAIAKRPLPTMVCAVLQRWNYLVSFKREGGGYLKKRKKIEDLDKRTVYACESDTKQYWNFRIVIQLFALHFGFDFFSNHWLSTFFCFFQWMSNQAFVNIWEHGNLP